MAHEPTFRIGGAELIDEVRELWMGLREHVCSRSVHFGRQMRPLTWNERRAEILGEGKRVRVEIAYQGHRAVAYCVCTVTERGEGEVDSIFVEGGHRGIGIGHGLMVRAVGWIEEQGAESIRLSVTWGNEEVLPFYAEHGFFPRSIVLMRK